MAVLPEVRRAGGLIGAEIRGLDLTREYPDQTYRAVRQAWAEHGVIFFRGQHLDAKPVPAALGDPGWLILSCLTRSPAGFSPSRNAPRIRRRCSWCSWCSCDPGMLR